jgi:hypothetical protein
LITKPLLFINCVINRVINRIINRVIDFIWATSVSTVLSSM